MNQTIETVELVVIPERMDSVYVFRNAEDADRFAEAVIKANGYELGVIRADAPICHAPETDALIAAEQED